LTPKCESLY